MIKNKKIYILIIIFYLINFHSSVRSENLIIPEKKPKISTERKVISELKNEILPLKKPKIEKKKNN